MNLREQLERASRSGEAPGGRIVAGGAAYALGLLIVALVLTFGLGAADLARGPAMVAGAIGINLLLAAGAAAALRVVAPALVSTRPSAFLFGTLVVIVAVVAAVAARLRPASPELVPIAFLALVTSALYDQRSGLLASVLAAVLLGAQPLSGGSSVLPVLLVAGGAAALVVRPTSQRDRSYVWMLAIVVAVAAAVGATGLATGRSMGAIAASMLRGAATSVVSVIVAMLVMPFAERLTGRETHLTLVEWGDLNRPLLQRLSLEAPGTYAHTIAIANLAEAASRAIGANALLARVGAYYHDIGKLAKPQYFVENQTRGRNPHDKLKPHTSASIIRNHVREGLELAEAEGVPSSIRAFITEHHGTGMIAYFMERAREREGGVANPADFAYPGPVPQSAETAIVMLADGVEAATRALAEPTPERIRDVIAGVVRQRLEQGQLRDAPLTMRQLTVVKQEFARVLSGMYHGRVDYPTPAVPTAVVRT